MIKPYRYECSVVTVGGNRHVISTDETPKIKEEHWLIWRTKEDGTAEVFCFPINSVLYIYILDRFPNEI